MHSHIYFKTTINLEQQNKHTKKNRETLAHRNRLPDGAGIFLSDLSALGISF